MKADKLGAIAEALRASGELDAYKGVDNPIEHEVAYDLSEIEESIFDILNKHIPVITSSQSPELVGQALFDIRENLRHILYHIVSSKYFSLICVPNSEE